MCKRWKSGTDVFLSKDGETFKELKAADYIPVGATLNVDGIKCRIDAVDFAADEVRLTNIEDKNRPIRFSETIQYVRSYVEDAGTAIYDTIPLSHPHLANRVMIVVFPAPFGPAMITSVGRWPSTASAR